MHAYTRGERPDVAVPLTKEAIRSAQLTYEGSFKDPEALKHWSGSGNLRSAPASQFPFSIRDLSMSMAAVTKWHVTYMVCLLL